MMADYYKNEILIEDISGMTDFQRIDSNLRTLLKSLEGTIPGSRGFGLSISPIDMYPNEARNAFCADLDEKVSEYIPEIEITDIDFEMHNNGVITLKIYVEKNSDWEGYTA
jgi:hypothetical protein